MKRNASFWSGFATSVLVGVASQANADTSIVSGCGGVSLPSSVVTNIMRPVVTGVVGPLEDGLNGLLGSLPGKTVDTDATGLLNQAATGQPVTLSALTTAGTLVSSGDRCITTTDEIGLDEQAGIAIGGNRITGLGRDGAIATASDIGSVAIGNNASTGSGARNALALGAGASTSVSESVAIGSASSTTSLLSAPAFRPNDAVVAGSAPIGEVSFGSEGNERRLTNVAAGAAGTDAANISQLRAVDARVTTLNTSITDVEADVTILDNRVTTLERWGIRYDGADKAKVTLGGANGTIVTNLRAGTLSRSSTDAVNGSQLNATNRALASLSELAVTYDLDAAGGRTNTLTLRGGNRAEPVRVRNVARGRAGTDAANVDQLREASKEARDYADDVGGKTYERSRAYTDSVVSSNEARLETMGARVEDVEDQARQAAAIGLAAASLRFDDTPGKFSFGVGGGAWRGQGAFAAGLGYTDESGKIRMNATASVADGNLGGAAGVSFTLN